MHQTVKPIVLITGANGSVAQRFAELMSAYYEFRFLSRNPVRDNEFYWNINQHEIDTKSLDQVDYIIHLAGAGIAEKRWSKDRKKEIIDSRVEAANLILENLKQPIKAIVSASAIGYYGAVTEDKILDENSTKGNDFLSEVVDVWEKSVDEFKLKNKTNYVVKLRLGAVLSKNSGALPKMMKPFDYHVGAALGSGKQWMPWVHIDDVCRLIQFSINHRLDGVYNVTANDFVTNDQFTQSLGQVIGRSVLPINVPSFVLRLILGEMSMMVLEGTNISSQKILDQGFRFEFNDLQRALKNLLN